MNKTTLQIPMDKDLRDAASIAATDLGFSSLQEYIRVSLKQLTTQKMTVKIEPESTKLSPKAIKRYNKMVDEYKKNKATTFSSNSLSKLVEHFENL